MKHFFFVIMVAVLILQIGVTFGQPPQTISYQGLLTTSSGTPLNGTYDLSFSLYFASTGGTALWTETHIGVSVQSGTFSVILGGTTSLSSMDFSQQLYLGITEGLNPEFSPRAEMTSAPSAFVSNAVNGTGNVTTSGVIDASGQSSKIRFYYDTFASFPSATTYHGMFAHAHDLGKAYFAHAGAWLPLALEVHKHSTLAASDGSPDTSMSVDANGNVGIGTTSPTKKLEITGSVKVTDTVFASSVSSNSPLRLQTGGTTRMYINDVNGNVGIGTSSPATRLDVNGGIAMTDTSSAFVMFDGFLTRHAMKTASTSGSTSILRLGAGFNTVSTSASTNVGIGTGSPTAKLHVSGTAGVDGIRFPDGTLQTTAAAGTGGGWMDDGTTVRLVTTTDQVGIGTTTPSKKLEVSGSVMVSDTVFASNVSSNSPLRLQTGGATRMFFDDVTGNIGIGIGDGSASTANTGAMNVYDTRSPDRSYQAITPSGIGDALTTDAGLGTVRAGTEKADMNATSPSGTLHINEMGDAVTEFIVGADIDNFQIGTFMSFGDVNQDVGAYYGQSTLNKGFIYWDYNGTPGNATFHLGTYNGSNPLVLQSAGGNVGIGTTSPSKKLHVIGSVKVSDTVFASSVSSNSPLRLQTAGTTRMYVDDASGNVGIGDGATSPSAQLHIIQTDAADALRIDDQSSDTSPFVIDQSGNVGIGTTSSSKLLHIKGDQSLGVARIERTRTGIVNATQGTLQLKATTTADMIDSFGPGIIFYVEDVNSGENQIAVIGAVRDGADNTAALTFSNATAEVMRISKDSNVGIGTSSPGASNLLELTSTTKGFVLPRMTKTQRDAISVPVAGMAIYQTDNTPGLRVYNGTNWIRYTETTD